MRQKLFGLLTLLFVPGLIALAGSDEIEFEEYDLDNGLHVILHQDHTAPIVSISVMYHVGSKNEKPSRTGFAHFFEHLMFEGTKNIDRGEYSEIVEKAGGTLNANTSNDRTYYYEIMPSNQLELGLWLEAERMLHAKVDSVGIATQKKVVIEEKKQRYDNRPYGDIMIQTMKRAFKEHPYRWTTIGDAEHIRAAENHEFQEFYDMFYVPNNAVLVLAGDFEKDEAKQYIEKYYGTIPKGTEDIRRPEANEPPLGGEVRDTVYDQIQLPAIIQAYRTPAMGSEDYYAVDLLAKMLSGGQSSRLHKKLVDEKELAMAVNLFPMPFEHPSVALTFALPNMGVDPQKLEDAMNAEIEAVKNGTIDDREFQKLKNQVESEFVNGSARLYSRANALARNYTYFKNTDLVNTEIEKYRAVTKADIKEAAKKYLTKDNRVVLYYLPESQKQKNQ
ncbi:MAG TPA: pitrilysin family protein [Salinivirga sp.]|uniref:M16 family metallopeptidase n=1 Tax=Salinivirga sp. TaxID=1970192 RepID=UPI002B497AA5|nr:pitrilysin family protein [Salinivirga sp.]HKK59346.1 pitrilysin family protein [Salinivirga sp.]